MTKPFETFLECISKMKSPETWNNLKTSLLRSPETFLRTSETLQNLARPCTSKESPLEPAETFQYPLQHFETIKIFIDGLKPYENPEIPETPSYPLKSLSESDH